MTIILIGHHIIHTIHTNLGDHGLIGTNISLILLISPIHITVHSYGYDIRVPKLYFYFLSYNEL
jgi:hypothetical protein